MFWADSIGSKYIHSKLDEWSKTYGDFFKPCAFLAERGSKGAPLVSICTSITFFFVGLLLAKSISAWIILNDYYLIKSTS